MGVLIASFVFSPIASALAQSSTASGTTSPADASIPVSSSSDAPTPDTVPTTPNIPPSASPNSPSVSTPASSVSSASAQPSTPAASPSVQSPSSPLTPGALTGPDLQPVVYNSFNQSQVKIDKNTGALDTTYPITIPPGRNGLQPDLDLIYNSQNSQQGNIFGEGWSIGIPYIERLNKSGVDNLYSTSTLNYFTSSLDGEIVSTSTVTSTASAYIARTENGAFNKYTYTSSTNQWAMIDKNGTQYTFGSSTDALQNDPNNASHVYKWMLKSVTDANNNTVTYNYTKDSGQIYPSSTMYTGTATSTGIFEVDFKLATTTTIDNATSSATGFPVNTNYRVSEIDAKANGTWVRKYVLGYTVGDNGYTTLLGSIAQSGENASGTVASLPSSTFAYQQQTPGWTPSSTWNPPTPFVSSSSADLGVRIPNLTGNGLPGFISNSNAWVDTGNGWNTSSTWISPVSFTTGSGGDNGYRVADVTGNGRADIISCTGSYVNNGAGWTSSSSWNSPTCFANGGVSTGAIMADANGDGLPDILYGSSSSTSGLKFQVDASGTLPTNLVSFYKLEDTTDYFGSNNLTNNNSVAFDSGKVNNAADFATSSSYLSLGSNLSTSTSNISTFGWVYLSSTSSKGGFWLNGDPTAHSGNGDGYGLGVGAGGGSNTDSAGNHLIGVIGFVNWLDFGTNIGTGWHMVGMTYDGTTWKGYIDGTVAATTYTGNAPNVPGNNFVIGKAVNNLTFPYFGGKVDEFGFWNKVLSSQEITNLYNSGSGQTMVPGVGTSSAIAYMDTGTGWATSTVWAPPIPFVAAGGLDNGTRVVDVNGDGLPDVIQGYADASGTAHYASYLNTGLGWATSTIWNPPAPFVTSGGWDTGMRIADVNGDGLPDFISDYTDISGNPTSSAYLNTGHGWTSDAGWDPPTVFSSNGGYDQGARVTDVLNSGLPSVISGYTDFQNNNQYAAWVNDNASRADLLTSITYPQGGNSAIQYQAASQFLNASGTVTAYVPYPVYVVAKITTSDGAGNTASSLSYQYSGGTYYYNTPFDHQFAGFSLVTQTDAAGNVTKTYYDTGNGNSSSTGQYTDNFWKIGKPYRVENYDNASTLYRKTINRWDSFSLGGNAAFVKLASSTESDYDGLSTHKDSAVTYAYDNTRGNLTQKIQWGQVSANDDGTFTDVSTSTDEYTTNYSYASSTTSNVIGKVSDETLLNQSSTKIQETQYFYDNLALGSVSSTGNLTKQEDWKSGSTYVNTVQNAYNGYGLVTTSLDPRNNTSTFAYDSYNLYPATSTNALSQTIGYQYDYSTGKPTQTVDPNKLTFQTSYDGFGRPLTVLQPDQVTTSTLDTKTTYAYTDTANAVVVHEADYLTATTTVDTYRYYDGLNRLIQTRKSATDAGIYKVSDRVYNNIGSVQKDSLPYFASSSAQTAATGTAALFAVYAYDPLGRVLTMTNAVGTTTNAYANWKITTTDPNGNTKDAYDDAYGNLIQVGEHNGSNTYTTTYSYDGLKDLLNLVDANGNIRSFAYDGLGRMVSSTDLRTPTSSTYGTWSFTYDDAGNLTTRVDPKTQTVNYTYDGLNRALTEDYTGAAGTEIQYAYDTCTNGVGRLCTVSSTDAVALTTKTYDPLGNLASETKTIDGTNYATSYTYDRQGNQLTVTNPDNSVVQYVYGTGGLVTSVQEEESGGSFTTLVSSIDYSPMDKITMQTDANGVTTVNTYDPTRLYRLNNTVTTDNGSGFGQMAPMGGGGRFGPLPPSGGGTTFSCTGAETSYTVPAGVTKLLITAFGAQGSLSGGLGGEVSGTLAVTSGTTYYINVGCQNGYNGGGVGGSSGNQNGGTGGGMTWFSANSVFTTSTVLLLAGGGGGKGGQGDNVGTGSPGAGGTGGGTSGSSGGMGSSAYCNVNECAGGGGGGSQNTGGVGGTPAGFQAYVGVSGIIGQGGFGGNADVTGGGGGGGGGGFYAGGGGAGNGYNSGGYMGGGGGGGSSYIAVTGALTSTSTVAGANSGDGSLTITAVTPIASLNQYLLNSTTTLSEGSSTNLGGVTFGATLNSYASTTLQLQVEVEPTGTAFVNAPNVTSSVFVSPGATATTTFLGITGGYHWQARQNDAQGNKTVWQAFGPSSTSTDFILNNTIIESYTGSVGSFTVPTSTPAHIIGLTITADGASGGSGDNAASNGGGGGGGGQVSGYFPVTPGATYYFYVGGQSGIGGGGTAGGGGSGNNSGANGGHGGDSTWISTQNTFDTAHAIVIAGGGGGGGGGGWTSGRTGGGGGNGDYPTGDNGGAGGGGGAGGTGGATSTNATGGIGGTGSGGTGATGGVGTSQSGAGGGGSGGNNGGGSNAGGGGGGGASFLSSTAGLVNTSTTAGANVGNGSLTIAELVDPVPKMTSSTQYRSDGVTPLNEGSSTTQVTVIFGATLNSYTGRNLQLQVEVEPTGTAFTNVANVTSSPIVTPGSVATTSFVGANRGYHWQARAIDVQNNTSTWQRFGPNTTSTDFAFAVPHINFTFPTQGTSTPNFSNWQLKADTVTSTDSYSLQVAWDDAAGNPVQSSTIMASGTQLLSGVNVPKTVFAGDYTYDGTPVMMNATATLSDASTISATSSVSFTEQTTAAPLNCSTHQIQCISYLYDNDGNITQVTDNSATNAAITVNYTYDSLNRLLTASSSAAASGQNYLQTFSYDPVGNILSGPQGSSTYAGTGYPNPDAVTKLVNGTSTTFTYDNDGNLTNASSGFNYTWDYNNRLLTATSTNSTSTYGYDYTSQRVKVLTGGVTTYYPETTYSVNTTVRTKHIFADGILMATVTNTTSTANAATLIQQATSTASSGTSLSTTLASNPNAGDALVLTLGAAPSSTSISSISGGGVTWAKAARSSTNRDSEVWYGLNSSGSGKNVTTTLSTACSGSCLINISEWSGIATSSALDATSTRTGSAVTIVTSPTSTTSNQNDLIIATERGTTSSVLTAGPTGAFTALAGASSSVGNSTYDVVTATVTTSTKWTFTSATSFDSVIAALKAATTTVSTTTVSYSSIDLLGGSNVETNASGSLVETLQYFPYGSLRVDNTAGSYAGEVRKYVGQQYDAATQLLYANARYYNGAQGQFISEDPVFLGDPNQQTLSNPQSLNAYSYSEDNPIVNSDPTGKQDAGTYALGGAAILTSPFWTPEAVIGAGLIGVAGLSYLAAQRVMQIGSTWYRSNSTHSPGIHPNSADAGGSGPPNPNSPKWIVGILGGVSTIAIGEKLYQSFNGQVGSTEDGFNITINNVNSLSNQISTSNSQPPHSSANTNTRPSPQSSGAMQFGGSSGGSGGTSGLQIQLLQLEVQVLQLQLQVAQSTRSTK